MGILRDHNPITIDEFNGLWARGDVDNTPLDHFSDALNIQSIGQASFGTRDGVGISQDVAVPLTNIKRIYNYPTNDGNTLIVLAYDYTTNEGSIFHVVNATTVFGPLLTITDMTDFAFIPYAGRAYISPFTTFDIGGLNVEKGLENEFLYVYTGDGTAARKAAGAAMSGTMTIANGAAGHTDPGFHVFGFVSETVSGYLSPPGLLGTFTTLAAFSVSFGSVDASGDPNVVARHLVATKVIASYNGDPAGYQFFFVPNASIPNNTDTFLNNISFFDQDLLDDASHLFDNFSEIPAGAALTLYHNRLVLTTTFDEISIGLISAIGEPEAISQIDGLITVPPDGNPITNVQELRDILYVFKRSRTVSFTDNGDEPSSWPLVVVDNALGTSVHGIATVLDSGSSSVDFLIICTYQGISLFNGRYITPELSWKIEDYWRQLNRNEFRRIQIINAPIQKQILAVLPNFIVLTANYANGMDPKKIRWWPWSYKMKVNTIAIFNIDEIILGSDLVV
jgi:hypothetical protein